MTFTPIQNAELAKPLDRKVVKPPAPGKYGDYVEGWHVIAEANRIFGFDGWTRETVEMVEVCRAETEIGRNKDAGWMVGYRAKVRVTACGIVREGSAVGNGEARKLYDAVESAVKEAETDAMKRALMTFGNPFGLALYDKSQTNVAEALPGSVQAMIDGMKTAADEGRLPAYWTEHWPTVPAEYRPRVLAEKEQLKAGLKLVATAAAG